MKRPLAIAVIIACIAVSGVSLAIVLARPATPQLPRLGAVPAFHLTDQAGQPFSTANLDGRVYVADFVFTSCSEVCPRMTEQMAKLQTYLVNRALPVRLVSISVDPERDTPARLLAFAGRFHARPELWSFLTGPMQEVQDAVVHGFKQTMTREQDAREQDGFSILHGTHFVLVDGKQQIRGYYDPTDGEAEARLRRDLSALIEHGGS